MMIRKVVKRAIENAVLLISKTSIGKHAFQEILDTAMNRESVVHHGSSQLTFAVPNRLSQYRIDTFSTKEPETLEWLDSIPTGSVLWDIGANIGLYSIYAAKVRNCRVYAFEPSVFNLELLARNIFLNDLHRKITLIPVALNDRLGTSSFKMSSTAWGGALSTFAQDFNQEGIPFKELFEYQTLGLSIDEMVNLLNIPEPDYIKIDVDGIEHFILRGAGSVLSNVKSVMIEINDNFSEQAEESTRLLENAGLSLHKKCDLEGASQFNQWWVRVVD